VAKGVAGLVVSVLIGLSYCQLGQVFGFSPADSARFLAPKNAEFAHLPTVQYLFGIVAAGSGTGALGPLSIAPLLIWLTSPSPSDAAIAQTTLIVLNLATLYVLVLRIAKLVTPAVGCVALALCAMQFRPHDDAFIGNIIVLPVASEFILVGLLTFVWTGEHERSIRRTVAAAILYGVGITIVPGLATTGLTFAAIFAFLTPAPHRKFQDVGVFAVVAILCFFVVDRQTVHMPSRDIFSQIIAGVPLVLRATSGIVRDHLSPTNRDVSFDTVPAIGPFAWPAVTIGALFAFGTYTAAVTREKLDDCLVMGASLWLTAALCLRDGTLLEVVGFALTALGSVRMTLELSARSRRTWAVAVSLAVFFVLYGNVRANALVVATSQRPWNALSTSLRAGAAGLFSGIPLEARVEVARDSALAGLAPYEDQDQLIYALSGRRFSEASNGPRWLLSEDFSDLEKSRAIRVVECQVRSPQCLSVRGNTYIEFVAMAYSDQFLDAAAIARGYSVRFERYDGFHVTAAVRRLCGAVPARDIVAPESPTYDWGLGFYPPQNPSPIAMPAAENLINGFAYVPDPPWRYAQSRSRLILRADRCAPRSGENVEVQLTLFSQLPGTVHFSAPGLSTSEPVTAAGVGRILTVHVPQRGSVPVDIVADVDRIALDPLIISRSEQQPESNVRVIVYVQNIGIVQTLGHP
jgi:hypothetical protein